MPDLSSADCSAIASVFELLPKEGRELRAGAMARKIANTLDDASSLKYILRRISKYPNAMRLAVEALVEYARDETKISGWWWAYASRLRALGMQRGDFENGAFILERLTKEMTGSDSLSDDQTAICGSLIASVAPSIPSAGSERHVNLAFESVFNVLKNASEIADRTGGYKTLGRLALTFELLAKQVDSQRSRRAVDDVGNRLGFIFLNPSGAWIYFYNGNEYAGPLAALSENMSSAAAGSWRKVSWRI